MNLLDTSAKEVEIFWRCLNLAKKTDPEMYGIMMMKGVSYLLEISSSLVVIFYVDSQAHLFYVV